MMRRVLHLRCAALLLLASVLSHPARGQAVPVVTYPAGTVQIAVPAAFTLEQGPGYLTLRWGATPNPTPPTPPAPPNPPAPVVTNNPLWVVAVVDKSATLPAGQAALVASKTIGPALADLNATWRVYDPHDASTAAWFAAWGDKVPKSPGLFVLEVTPGKTSVYSTGALPDNEGALTLYVKSARGKL